MELKKRNETSKARLGWRTWKVVERYGFENRRKKVVWEEARKRRVKKRKLPPCLERRELCVWVLNWRDERGKTRRWVVHVDSQLLVNRRHLRLIPAPASASGYSLQVSLTSFLFFSFATNTSSVFPLSFHVSKI